MNRIDAKFEELKKAARKGLVGYLTAGDPDVETSEKDIRTAIEAGLDVLELGVPFSDPTADGPVIQAAAHRALESGMTLPGVLDLVRRLRADYDIPIIMFGYANPLYHYGYEKICSEAAEAGVDGMLVVDLPHEESSELKDHLDRNGLHFISLVAPTTPKERMKTILSEAGGFIYYIMVTGVTGARAEIADDIDSHVNMLRECTDLPIAVGFGVSSGEQARQAGQSADAVVVGSAMIRAAREGDLARFMGDLRAGLDAG